MVKRSIQVENVLSTTRLNSNGTFDRFNETDVVNSVWIFKAAEDIKSGDDVQCKNDMQDDENIGPYRVYKECGTFDGKHAIYKVAFTLAILVLWVISVLSVKQARQHQNAQMLASTAFKGNDREDMSSGIPLLPIGVSTSLNVDGAPRYRGKSWSKNPEMIRIQVDTGHNRGRIQITPPGQIHVNDVFQS